MRKNELIYFPSWVAGRSGYAERIRQVFDELHRQKGLRVTRQRQVILNHLLMADRHIDMEEIYQSLKSKGIGKITVFRALKLLEQCGFLSRVTAQGGRTLYEINLDRPHHDHLVCLGCGRIQEVQWPGIEKIQQKICHELGFWPTFHRHEVYGQCQSCVKKGSSAHVKER